MNLKNFKFFGVFAIFLICFLAHFGYSTFPCFLTSILFPVNESIFEHLKIIVFSILLWSLFEFFILKFKNIYFNNYIFSIFVECLISIISFLIIFYPLYFIFGHVFLINILCLFISICVGSFFGYKILLMPLLKHGSFLGFLGIVLIYVLFGILTYYPLKTPFFYDTSKDKYGINITDY